MQSCWESADFQVQGLPARFQVRFVVKRDWEWKTLRPRSGNSGSKGRVLGAGPVSERQHLAARTASRPAAGAKSRMCCLGLLLLHATQDAPLHTRSSAGPADSSHT